MRSSTSRRAERLRLTIRSRASRPRISVTSSSWSPMPRTPPLTSCQWTSLSFLSSPLQVGQSTPKRSSSQTTEPSSTRAPLKVRRIWANCSQYRGTTTDPGSITAKISWNRVASRGRRSPTTNSSSRRKSCRPLPFRASRLRCPRPKAASSPGLSTYGDMVVTSWTRSWKSPLTRGRLVSIRSSASFLSCIPTRSFLRARWVTRPVPMHRTLSSKVSQCSCASGRRD